MTCNDTTATTVEACNNADDDCDLAIDEDFDLVNDINNCGQCGQVCTNAHGGVACALSTCSPSCSPGAADCDGNAANGCELFDSNPACAGAGSMGIVNGDSGGTLTRTGSGEAYFSAVVREGVTGAHDLSATITLTSPPGTNYDLDVTCTACGLGTLASNSTGTTDTIGVFRAERSGTLDTFTILIGVRWTSGATCDNWTLGVVGNLASTPQLTCN